MKRLAQTKALERLQTIREEFRNRIRSGFEHRAKDCETCETKGICCTDAHFVNVRITRLEATIIIDEVSQLPEKLQRRVRDRISKLTLDKILQNPESTWACPLFEPEIGCLVHSTAKPLPCINHACYENLEDVPGEELLDEAEKAISAMNTRVYGNHWTIEAIPIWLDKHEKR
ncbi:MAG: hypothetical protein R2684_08880 [Pyrinomonadaceae bacterium]